MLRKYWAGLVILLVMAQRVVAQSTPSDLLIPSSDGTVTECPAITFSTQEEAQQLWQRVVGSENPPPLHIFSVYGSQTVSAEQFKPFGIELSCTNWAVWQIVNGVPLEVPLSNCDSTPTLNTYGTGIYWLIPPDAQAVFTAGTTPANQPPDSLIALGDDLSGNYSLVAYQQSEDVVAVDIWNHQTQAYSQMFDDLQGIEPISYLWRLDKSELTILARYDFDQRIVIVNYNPEERTFNTFIESRNTSLACTHLRWLNAEALAVGFNAYFSNTFQVQTVSFPDATSQVIDATPRDLREIFIETPENAR